MVANEALSWKEEIMSTLAGAGGQHAGDSSGGGGVNVKGLRKMLFVARQLDDKDKTAKKTFKMTIQQLESENLLQVTSDGQVTLVNKKKKRKQNSQDGTGDAKDSNKKAKKMEKETKKKAKKVKKEKKRKTDDEVSENAEVDEDAATDDDDDGTPTTDNANPSGVTRLFVGNLPFKVDETSLSDFLPGLTHIKWVTDMETGRFYGSSFVEMEDAKSAAMAVAKSGRSLLGRPIKINYAPPRPGDLWPPKEKIIKGNGPATSSNPTDGGETTETNMKKKKLASAGGVGVAAMGEKPVDCHKLFVGNLSYEIDDDVITKFFATVDAEIKAIRWIHHKETGFFKGVGFVEFWNTEACEKAATLNGKTLLGRPIRIDWTD